MARFDIFVYPEGGYLLDVQCDYLERLNTRLVVPLLPVEEAPPPAKGLNPVFEIAGADYVMMTQYMAAVSVAELTAPAGSLSSRDSEIVSAIDMIISGF